MGVQKTGNLAIRAISQYRRRDVLSYLGLRYYLANSAAKSDIWIQKVAVNLPLTRDSKYFTVEHFKEILVDGSIKRRKIYLPSPNDSLAETALLNECSKYPFIFGNPKSVFSYDLAKDGDKSGVFKIYVRGLRKRQLEIAKACKKYPKGIVEHTDIENFYPSITTQYAEKIWLEKCTLASMPERYVQLGRRLIESYSKVSEENGRSTILVGPMFSHFLANMILHDLDRRFENQLSASYFRYVDDMTFVGNKEDVKKSIEIVRAEISKLGLVLHSIDSPKNIRGTTSDWMKYKSDFLENDNGGSWKTLIGSIKLLLISKPDQMSVVEKELRDRKIGLPIYHYNAVARERSSFEIFKTYPYFFLRWVKSLRISTATIIKQAEDLRDKYLIEVSTLSHELIDSYGFHRKSAIPKIRYRVGRLIYLCPEEQLKNVSEKIAHIPELNFYVTLIDSIVSGNINKVLDLGADVAQATAQLFKAIGKEAFYNDEEKEEVREHGIAIFLLNGVEMSSFKNPNSELQQLAVYGSNLELMNSKNAFIQEVACLHGIGEKPKHSAALESIFDIDEDFVFDVLENFDNSLS